MRAMLIKCAVSVKQQGYGSGTDAAKIYGDVPRDVSANRKAGKRPGRQKHRILKKFWRK